MTLMTIAEARALLPPAAIERAAELVACAPLVWPALARDLQRAYAPALQRLREQHRMTQAQAEADRVAAILAPYQPLPLTDERRGTG